MLKRLVVVSALTLALAGCVSGQSGTTRITVDSSRLKPALKLAKPGPIKLERVKWIVVTKENAGTVLDGVGGTAVALTPAGFSKLQRNNAKLLALVKKYRKIIVAYEANDR
jgi:hypothetical protein